MDIWETNKLILFIAFFVPGFISIKVYDLLIPGEKREPMQILQDAIAYSCVNYAILSWLIYLDIHFCLSSKAPMWHAVVLVIILFLTPVLLAVAYYSLRKSKFFNKHLPHPVAKPWDYIFGKKKSYWVILELTDGTRIGGMYDAESFTSSFPSDEQIYLQQVWEIDGRRFIRAVDRSKGVIVSGKDIKFIEFFD